MEILKTLVVKVCWHAQSCENSIVLIDSSYSNEEQWHLSHKYYTPKILDKLAYVINHSIDQSINQSITM